ncbi:hypothetical protein GCM10011335_35250 [Aureimonas glaciei]|uniref:Uncharacterized protein n=1 Tax=Aureimonas glaciei TaxID=1776957 RepID=A0A916Y394_9HYPH|nr:hypothetical protein GCM10011335_35250 [Aureimonas glaciei]
MTDRTVQLSDMVKDPSEGRLVTPTPRPGYHPVHSLPGFLKEKLVQLDLAAAQMKSRAKNT